MRLLWKAGRSQDASPRGVLLIVDAPEKDTADGEERPPGHFMEEQHADDTARFIAEVKRLAARRGQPEADEGWAHPSRPDRR